MHAHLRDGVSATSQSLLAALALPDTNSSTLHSILLSQHVNILVNMDTNLLASYLATEGAGVGGVLGDFHLLNLLSERGTITSAVLASDAD